MKSKMIITCVCLGLLGSTFACSGDEQATNVKAETASPQAKTGKAQDSAVKPPKANVRPSAKREDAPAKEADSAGSAERNKLTNADCFPDSLPESAPSLAKMCLGLAKSQPDMLFPKSDYDGMPEDCKPYVLPHCR